LKLIRSDAELKAIFRRMPEHAATKYCELLDEDEASDMEHDAKLNEDVQYRRQREDLQVQLAHTSDSDTKQAINGELVRLESKREKRRAAPSAHTRLPEKFTRVLRRVARNAKFVDAREPAPLKKGETIKGAFTRTRGEIVDTTKEKSNLRGM